MSGIESILAKAHPGSPTVVYAATASGGSDGRVQGYTSGDARTPSLPGGSITSSEWSSPTLEVYARSHGLPPVLVSPAAEWHYGGDNVVVVPLGH